MKLFKDIEIQSIPVLLSCSWVTGLVVFIIGGVTDFLWAASGLTLVYMIGRGLYYLKP